MEKKIKDLHISWHYQVNEETYNLIVKNKDSEFFFNASQRDKRKTRFLKKF